MSPIIMQTIIIFTILTLTVFIFDIDIAKLYNDSSNFISCIFKPFCNNLSQEKILASTFKKTFFKLNPFYMLRNPLIFIVEVGAIIITVITFSHAIQFADFSFNLQLSLWLWFTVICANFVESISESNDNSEADEFDKTKMFVSKIAKNGKIKNVPVISLKRGDLILLKKNQIVPCDGVLFHGIALIDESFIRGKSVSVVKEADTDRNAIMRGSKVLYGSIKLKITMNQSLNFFDQFLDIAENIKSHKTPEENAVEAILITLTILFLGVIICLVFFADYSKVIIATSALIALLVCLLPTTIGALLPAIGPSCSEESSKSNFCLSNCNAMTPSKVNQNTFMSATLKHNFNNILPNSSTQVSDATEHELSSTASYVSSDIHDEQNIFSTTGDGLMLIDGVLQQEIGVERLSIIDFQYLFSVTLNILGLGKQILIARGNLVIFSVCYDIAKYFAIIPALWMSQYPVAGVLNIMHLASVKSAVLSVVIFNALIIFFLIPFAALSPEPTQSETMLKRNIRTYGFLGLLLPFVGIKLINVFVVLFHWA